MCYQNNKENIVQLYNDLENKIMLFDCYVPSAITYRMAECVDKNWVVNINSVFPKADIGFFIDITPDESVKRNIDTKFNIKSTLGHLNKVRNAYLSILDENKLIYINGMQPIEKIFDEVVQKIEEFRKENGRKVK